MSTLVAQTISNGTVSTSSANVIQGSAKAWVKYDGIAQTIYASYNVSSVTYLATGRYQINFTTAFSSANYASSVTSSVDGTGGVSGSMKYANTEQTSTYLAGSCVVVTQLASGPSSGNTSILSAIFTG
jgi:hypothetical protein